MNPLTQLEACGQSPWLDYLRRSLVESGELRRLIQEDGLKGVTSNPSIFEKAIAETDEYTDALTQFQTLEDHPASAIYEHLALTDIRAAADVLRPVYEQTRGRDGYISLECSPYLADDTKATIAEAVRLWAAVERPNLMVKVPATSAGIPAIRQLIGLGLNINVTLLFAVDTYEQVAEAYISGLEDLARAGGDVSRIGSVASIFVSRIDGAIDKRLDGLGDPRVADRFRGKVAIANAKLAYARYQALFSSLRWRPLAASGANTQRLLWASTSTKNPAYRDTMYVEELIGRDTVDTIPPTTMDAFRDHGKVTPDAVEQGVAEARALLAELQQQGISLDEVTKALVEGGVQQFADAFDKLLSVIAGRRRALLDGDRARPETAPGSPELKSTGGDARVAPRVGGKHMQIGVIGLGRMGGNIARRLMKAGHRCVVFDANPKPREALAREGATAVQSLAGLVQALEDRPRAVWVMLPSGRVTEEAIVHLGGLLEAGDIVIDGGNSFYKDDIRRAKGLSEKHICYVDCGTSGGIWGLERGYCMVIGGPKNAVDHLDPIFAALAPGSGDIAPTPGRKTGDPRAERGYIHAGPTGAGHFVKMIHNGIEYGLMQAFGEGFDILSNKNSKDLPEGERFSLNLPDIAEVWRRGSVISSWLLDLGAAALAKDPQLKGFSGFVQDSGEGRWTVEAAIEEAVPAHVLSSALYARFRSRQQHTFAEKMLSAMRFGFGGHIEGKEPIDPEPQSAGPKGPQVTANAAR
jgi:6-phosphogluconate dehydrogenase (decarboxylating)/transaldolase